MMKILEFYILIIDIPENDCNQSLRQKLKEVLAPGVTYKWNVDKDIQASKHITDVCTFTR